MYKSPGESPDDYSAKIRNIWQNVMEIKDTVVTERAYHVEDAIQVEFISHRTNVYSATSI